MKTVDLGYSLEKLLHYIESEGYVGWDPFDGLSSPIFQLPVLRSSRLLRFGYQQIHRRLPFNVRPLLGIKKEINPVTLGLCVQGYSYLSLYNPEKEETYKKKIDWCIDRLIELKSKGFSGACWGYNFNWEARYASIPAFTPTIVATGFITNALFECHKLTGNSIAAELCINASKFVIKDINKTSFGVTFCYSYSPNDHQVVYNATIKGARLLAQVYSLTGDEFLIEEAKKTVNFVINNQNEDGSWSYSSGDSRSWSDNFHTAYIIDSLQSYIENTGSIKLKKYLFKAIDCYLKSYFTYSGMPKYFVNKIYPIDSTNVAQSIITLSNINNKIHARKIAKWYINIMQSKEGYYYFRKHRYFIDRNNYMRWSNAWLFVALSKLLYLESKYN